MNVAVTQCIFDLYTLGCDECLLPLIIPIANIVITFDKRLDAVVVLDINDTRSQFALNHFSQVIKA